MQISEEADSAQPEWTVSANGLTSMTLHFSLGGIRQQQIQAEGKTWQALTIDGGGLRGEIGTPGMPTASRLVEIPVGATVTARVVSQQMTDLEPLVLLPVQADGAETFSGLLVDSQGRIAIDASVSKPAIMAGRQVVSVTVQPLNYDTSSGAASIAGEMEIELIFEGGDSAPNTRLLPTSFADFFTQHVSGYRETNKDLGDNPGRGTWLLVSNGNAEALAHLEPLIQWRGRQGYHVETINTATTGTSTSSIKAAIQAVYDDTSIAPLEFISLAGDAGGSYSVATWHESLSGYGGEGDHYYTTLDGADVLADAHIGRLTYRDIDQLDIIVGKITGYEQTPPMADTAWFGRACLLGDPSSSGITTIYVNQWLKGQLFANGWTQVDTTWGGNFVAGMNASVNEGVSAFGYRGYLGMSGISTGSINALSNGGKLALAVLPTCDTGTFASYDNCRSEAWLRAPYGGGVAAVGTATIGTHTRYNNCYYHGIWDGVLNGADSRVGVAHTLGKVELFNNYYLAEPHVVEIWSVWNTLMGDPATEIWRGVPAALTIQHPVQVSEHGQAVVVQATGSGGQPLSGAVVCLYRAGEAQVVALTDASGAAVLEVPALSAGAIQVTVSKAGFLPYLSSLTVGVADVECLVSTVVFDDDQNGSSFGNGDGHLNPGESLELMVSLTNFGTTTAAGVTAVLTAVSAGASVQQGNLVFGDIAAGNELGAKVAAVITIDSTVSDGQEIRWLLTATNGISEWTSLISGTIEAGTFTVTSSVWGGGGSGLDPGEAGSLVLDLSNTGSIAAAGLSAILSTESPWVVITDEAADFGTIDQDGTGSNSASPFALTIASDCYVGHLAVFQLAISSGDGYQAESEFTLTVGSAGTDAPTGPDQYGYYAYDNTDTASGIAPVYDWVAIDPDHGGTGVDLGLTDFGWEQDDTKTITLPFAFSYYGQEFTEISICSNGWLAMGETPLVNYRNFGIPAKGSPGNMIAPFWDNLNQTGNRKVYTQYDETGHRFIVQWFDMPNHYSGAVQNFEVLLLDPVWHGSGSGDGTIIFQYEQVGNTDARDGYATVGIQNEDRTDGVLYSYWNQYAASAAHLSSGRAIAFVPLEEVAQAEAQATPASFNESAVPETEVVSYLHIANVGAEGSQLNFDLAKVDPIAQSAGESGGQENDPEAATKSLSGSTVTFSQLEYDSGSTMTLNMNVSCVSNDQEWIIYVQLDVPEGVSVVEASSIASNNPLEWSGVTGSNISTAWDNGNILDNSSAQASLTLHFAADLVGEVTLGWSVIGDDWGSQPHQVSGEIVMSSQDPTIYVNYPTSGMVATLGESLPVSFTATNGPEMVDIAIQRLADGPWQTLAEDVPAAGGLWNWTVVGEPGPYAMIRVSDAADPGIIGLSGLFGIGRNLDWLQLGVSSGSLASGQTQDVTVTLSAVGLPEAQYDANVIFSSNGGSDVVIPVQFLVSATSAALDIPDQVMVWGNYPNPFNPQTVIKFSLPGVEVVDLSVYSARGHLVKQLLTGSQQAGYHQVIWDGRDAAGRTAASGVYFYRLKTSEGAQTGKMMLTK